MQRGMLGRIMDATLIVNPFSTNVTEQRLREVESVLAPARTILTERPGHATELEAETAGTEAIVVYGGDGSAASSVAWPGRSVRMVRAGARTDSTSRRRCSVTVVEHGLTIRVASIIRPSMPRWIRHRP